MTEASDTESERAHHAMTAGCLRTDLEYVTRERDEALSKRDDEYAELDKMCSMHSNGEQAALAALQAAEARLAEYAKFTGEARKVVSEMVYGPRNYDDLSDWEIDGGYEFEFEARDVLTALTAAEARGFERGKREENAACVKIASEGSFPFDIEVWMNSTKKEMTAHTARAIAAAIRAQFKRIAELESELKRTREALDIAREYLEDAQDVNWEGTGPNDQMKCLQETNEAMEKR